ncbi:hypothetical protein ACVWZ4_001065 [Bradyrhizobium sp. USDA 4472]
MLAELKVPVTSSHLAQAYAEAVTSLGYPREGSDYRSLIKISSKLPNG